MDALSYQSCLHILVKHGNGPPTFLLLGVHLPVGTGIHSAATVALLTPVDPFAYGIDDQRRHRRHLGGSPRCNIDLFDHK